MPLLMGKIKRRFTLVEMLIVVFVIAALVAVFGPAQQYIFKDTEKTSMQADAKGISTASAQYLAEHDSLPVMSDTVTVADKNVQHIVKEQLEAQGVNDTLFNSLNGVAFKKIDEKAISPYIKGDKSQLGEYFIVDKVDNIQGYKNNLLGYVFTMEAYATHDGKVYSGEFAAITQPNAPTVTPEPWKSMGYTAIGTAEELNAIRDKVDSNGFISGKYVLVKDIDLSEYLNWEPIGWDASSTNSGKFNGEFIGNGYSITGLTMTDVSKNGVGLFGHISGAIVKDLYLDVNINLTNSSYQPVSIGGLSGYISGWGGSVTISNVHVTGSVTGGRSVGGFAGTVKTSNTTPVSIDNSSFTGDVSGQTYVAGFVGTISNDITITNSYSSGTVKGSGSEIGGFFGSANWIVGGNISNNYSTASVTSTSASNYLGGFGGSMYNTVLSNNYATGNVTGNYPYNAGFVGSVNGTSSKIINSYATGNVSGSNASGFVAYIKSAQILNSYSTGNVNGSNAAGFISDVTDATITNSYSIGSVTGSSTLGGFVATVSGTTNSFTSNYWDITTSGTTVSATGEGKTTEEMKQSAVFVGWDFTNIWSIDENVSYPTLR